MTAHHRHPDRRPPPATGLYIMRNAFESVPRELGEAALVDGANSWQILRRVFLPTMVPALITVTLFAFVTSWNEFLGAW
jgi:multiple sugar transport system permease protein